MEQNNSTLLDILQSLCPTKEDNETYSYKYKNIDFLDNIAAKVNDTYKLSNEKNKTNLLFLINFKLKELFVELEDYERAYNFNRPFSKFALEYYNDNGFDNQDIHYLINECIAQIKFKGKLDTEFSEFIDKVFNHLLCEVNLYPSSSSDNFYFSEDESISIGFNRSNYFNVFIYCLVNKYKTIDNNKINEYVLFLSKSIINWIYIFYDDNILNIINNLQELKNLVIDNRFYDDGVFNECSKYLVILLSYYVELESLKFIFAKKFDEEWMKCGNENKYQNLNKKEQKILINKITNLVLHILSYNQNPSKEVSLMFKTVLGTSVIYNNENLFDDILINNIDRNQINKDLMNLIMENKVNKMFNKKQYEIISNYYLSNNSESWLPIHYFKIAYSLYECGFLDEAKELYEKLIESNNTSSAIYNNLAIIYESKDELPKALELITKAVRIDKDNEIFTNNLKRIKDKIVEEKDRKNQLETAYFKKTNKYHKSILFAIYKSMDTDLTIDDLFSIVKQDEKWVSKNIDELIDLKLIKFTKNTEFIKDIVIEPLILKLIEDYIDPSIEREIVKVDNNKLYRSIFFSESEIMLYKVLMELFPQHLVFPNMSLKTIIDVDKIKELFDKNIIDYLFTAHVDFAIVSTLNYFPIIAFEKDSNYHDEGKGKENTNKKNQIFKASGLPLVRLRFNNNIKYEKLKSDVKKATKDLILEIEKENGNFLIEISKEIDIKKFGVVESPVDLDKVTKEWETIVGSDISKKSKVIDIIDGFLEIEVSKGLEPTIKLIESTVFEKLSTKFDVIKKLIFLWYE